MKHRILKTWVALMVIVLCLSVALSAGRKQNGVWREGLWRQFWTNQSDDAKFAANSGVFRVHNNEGSTIWFGHPVELDGTAITVVTSATASATMTVADTLADESGVFWLVVSGDADTAGTVLITGTDSQGNALSAGVTIPVSATFDAYISGDLWASVTAVNASAIKTTNAGCAIIAYPFMTVNNAEGSPTTDLLFGTVICSETVGYELRKISDLTTGSIVDTGEGFVLGSVKAPIQVICNESDGNASILPGDLIELTSSGDYQEQSTTPDFFTWGVAASPGATSTGTPVWGFPIR